MKAIKEYEMETERRIEEIISFYSESMEVCGRKWHRLYITYEREAGYTEKYVYPEFRPVEYMATIPQSEKLKKALCEFKFRKEVEEYEREVMARPPFHGIVYPIIE